MEIILNEFLKTQSCLVNFMLADVTLGEDYLYFVPAPKNTNKKLPRLDETLLLKVKGSGYMSCLVLANCL